MILTCDFVMKCDINVISTITFYVSCIFIFVCTLYPVSCNQVDKLLQEKKGQTTIWAYQKRPSLNPYNQSMDTLHNIIEYMLQEVPTSTLNQFPRHIYQSIGLGFWSSAILCLCQHLKVSRELHCST